LQNTVRTLVELYEQSINYVKGANNQEVQDFLARRLYDMTGDIMMSLLILDDATHAPHLFTQSANVYVHSAEEDVIGKSVYVKNFIEEDLVNFRAKAQEVAE
jgi:hypothetical protein